MAIVAEMAALSLEQILASDSLRSLLRAFARTPFNEHLIDFLLLLSPYHQPEPNLEPATHGDEAGSNLSPSLPPAPHPSPDQVADIYSFYIQAGASFRVPLSPPLARAFQVHCEPRSRRSSLMVLPVDLPPQEDVSGTRRPSCASGDPVALLQAAYREVSDVVEREVLDTVKWLALQDAQKRGKASGGSLDPKEVGFNTGRIGSEGGDPQLV